MTKDECDHLLARRSIGNTDYTVDELTVSSRKAEYSNVSFSHLHELVKSEWRNDLFTFCPRCGIRNTGPGFEPSNSSSTPT